MEEGLFTFEVRAIDRAGNVDPTPAIHIIDGADTSPPETIIAEKPPLLSNSRAATFTFTGTDNLTPPQFLEYECRLDTRDPDLWLECFNPTIFSNLTSGAHTIEVRASTATRTSTRRRRATPGPVGGQPPELRPGQHHADAARRRLGRRGQPGRELPLRDRAQRPLGRRRRPDCRAAGAGHRRRTPARWSASRCPPTRPTASWSRPRCASTTSRRPRAHARGRAARRPLEGEHAHLVQPARRRCRRQPGRRPPPRDAATWSGTSPTTSQAMLETRRQPRLADPRRARERPRGRRPGLRQPRDCRRIRPSRRCRSWCCATRRTAAPPPPPPTRHGDRADDGRTAARCSPRARWSANDLIDCLGEGLVIGAPNIVVDLNGHTIDGPDYLLVNISGQEEGFPAGIRISGHTNVVIRNGTVQRASARACC